MLLASLNPTVGTDIGAAVHIDGTALSRADLLAAATAGAERVVGAGRVAVLATPTMTTVLAVTGCLIAGVPFSTPGTTNVVHVVRLTGQELVGY